MSRDFLWLIGITLCPDRNKWWDHEDSNLEPTNYEFAALTSWAMVPILAPRGGFEPPAYGLEVRCSILLSYRGKGLLAEIFILGCMLTMFTLVETTLGLSLFLWCECSNQLVEHDVYSIRWLVGIRGLEPRTCWLRVSCSTNWAIFPWKWSG